MAAQFVASGWDVTGTARAESGTGLHGLANTEPERVKVVRLDIAHADQVDRLREELADRRFDMLFVNAGIIESERDRSLGKADEGEFVRVMVTNVLGPMRVVEAFGDLVAPDGLIGVMSSLQGSVAANETGGMELYRASKAALNQAMRSHAARGDNSKRPLVAIVPGWVRTDMGGEAADLSVAESVAGVIRVLDAKRSRPGLEYLDHLGRTVRW